MVRETTLPRSSVGLLQADEHCAVPGFERVIVAGDSGSFLGPDWMPKQAHMADLQATAAATKLVDELADRPVTATFKVELMCIVDSGDKGMFVSRTAAGSRVLPPFFFMHWLKRFFAWWYLRQYR